MAATFAAVVVGAPPAQAKQHMLVGLLDEASALYGNPDIKTYPILKKLRVQVVRVNLYWGATTFAVVEPATRSTPIGWGVDCDLELL